MSSTPTRKPDSLRNPSTDKLIRYWDKRAEHYSLFARIPLLGTISRAEYNSANQLLVRAQALEPLRVFLNLGAGSTAAKINVAAEFSLHLDLSKRMLLESRKDGDPTWKLVQASADLVPFPKDSVDCVLALGLTEYLPDLQRFLQEAARILRPGGCFVISFSRPVPLNRLRRLYNPTVKMYSIREIEHFRVSSGFDLIESRTLLLQEQQLWCKQKQTT